MKKRILAFMLVMSMVMSSAPATFAADETFEAQEVETIENTVEDSVETESETSTYTLNEETESETESEIESETEESEPEIRSAVEVDINPIYADVITEEELLALISENEGIALFSNPEYVTSEAILVGQLRDAMEARMTSFSLYYAVPEALESGWLPRWTAMATEENGSATQGDYIRYHYGGGSAKASYYTSSGVYYYTINFEFVYHAPAEQEAEVTGKVNSLIRDFGFTTATSEYEKIKTIYDWMCKSIVYDYANLNDESYKLKYSAYAALINRTSVCQGYASLFYRLCREVGLDVRVISGTVNEGNHVWNIVRIGNVWYNLDATWDAGQSSYSYFLRCNSNFTDHERDYKFLTSEFNRQYAMSDNDYAISSGGTWKISYDANGGTGAPAAQAKSYDGALKLSSTKPTKKYTITYNASGGTVSTVSKTVSATFNAWNTKADGSGTSYKAGGSYTANAGATLYAQWTNPKAGTLVTPVRSGYTFDGWYTAKTGGTKITPVSEISKNLTVYAQWTGTKPVYNDDVEAFVAQLYNVCLDREPDKEGLSLWSSRLKAKEESGVSAAYGFIFSNEFKNKNLCNEDYIEQLYKAFMGRSSDAAGKALWLKELISGKTREEVFNGFALSNEFANLCKKYGIAQGMGIEIPKYGTVPTGSCSVCGAEDGVTGFVKRLYMVCLNRNADAAGLTYWTNELWNHTNSGRGVAYGFIFSTEFTGKNYNDSDYVEHLYKAFMGRASDAGGKATWLRLLKEGWSREQVFDGFVGSNEFSNICSSYGIIRD